MELKDFKDKLDNIREEYAQIRLDIESRDHYERESWSERLKKIENGRTKQ